MNLSDAWYLINEFILTSWNFDLHESKLDKIGFIKRVENLYDLF
jgi:hypothetical protein